MDDMSLDMSHELDISGHMHVQSREQKRLMQNGMLPDESGNMGKKKRPMRGLRTKAKKRPSYDY